MGPFTIDIELKVLICQGCGYAVRRSQVKTHLLRHHQNLRDQARTIIPYAEALLSAEDELRVEDIPTMVPYPIPTLMSPRDGLSCELNDRTCQYICGNVKSMKEHCRKVHQWKQRLQQGRPARIPTSSTSRVHLEPWRFVRYQQLFPSGPGSHFIEVLQEEHVEPSPTTVFSKIDQLRTEAQQATWTTIQQADPREVSPWLERTRWTAYLEGIERANLLTLLDDPDPVRAPQEALIKTTVMEMIKFCQESVSTTAGIFVRFEAIQSDEQRGRRKQPLVPYVHTADLDKSSRPWVHIVLFFVRVGRVPASHHPQYQLRPDQDQYLQTLLTLSRTIIDHEDSSRDQGERFTPLHTACLQFCLSLLRQEVRTHEYESPFICALAVLGVTEDGWKGPDQYPSLLSALLKTSRYMFVQSAIDRTTLESVSTLKLLREDVSRYMFRGTFTPFDWMYELRAYGMKIAFNTNREGCVEWDGETLLYGKLQFTIRDFRTFVHGLHHAVREILQNELLIGRTISTEVPTVLLSPLRDDLRRKTSGWCFLQDSRNHFPVHGDTWLWQQVQSRFSLRTKFFPGEARMDSWPAGVQAYFHSLAEFRTKLLLLIHLVSGQPARGSELLTVRFRNTSEGEHRNIFLEGGLINVTTLWHKGYTISGSTKPINRFLPSEVSEDLVRYLWLVQPFVERLEVHYCQTTQLSAFLWPTEPGSSRPRRTEDVRRSLQQESFVGLGQVLNVQQYRHIAIAISRKFLKPPYQFHDHEDRTITEEEDHILDQQAAHTSSISASIYARGIHEQSDEIFSLRQRYRDASIMWHDLLGFHSVRNHELTPTGAKHRLPFRDQLEHDARRRKEEHRTMDHVQQLHRLVGPQAQFRTLQEEALLTILSGHSPILTVMPTGGGKSLLFQLPASYDQHGTTIVVVPLIALRHSLGVRSTSYGLFTCEWNPRQPPDQAQVVLVTPEAAITDSFALFLNRLRTKRQLDRIVFDECHLLLDMDGFFRPAFLQLRNLLLYETQFLFLTATLPPSREDDFWTQLHLEKSRPLCFRTKTTRSNLSYRVTVAMDQELDQAISDLIQSALPGQIIIYCRTIPEVARLAQYLGCGQYTARSSEKDQDLERFMNGTCRTIVATSALGLGIDVPAVSLVIHSGLPYSLIDFSQESGRAGRNGARCQSVIVRDDQPLPSHVEEPLRRFLSTHQCRRRILDQYFDGTLDRTRCLLSEAGCDRCEVPSLRQSVRIHSPILPDSRPASLPGQLVRHGLKGEALQVEVGLQQFQRLATACFICLHYPRTMADHDAGEHHHDSPLSQSYDEAFLLLQQTIRLQKYAGCFFCGLPQSTCSKWEANDQGGYRLVRAQSCRFPEVLWRGLAGILVPCAGWQRQQDQVWQQAAQGGADRTKAGLIWFFGRKIRMGGWETNEGVRQFLQYYGPIIQDPPR